MLSSAPLRISRDFISEPLRTDIWAFIATVTRIAAPPAANAVSASCAGRGRRGRWHNIISKTSLPFSENSSSAYV